MSWLHDKTTDLLARVQEAKDQKAFPFFRPFENVGPRVKMGAGSFVNFTSNDYLGLSQHPKLIKAAVAGTQHYGTGLGSARPQATSVRHEELERRLAQWLSYDDCAVFTTGYQALVGVLQAFCDDETSLILDKLSHASIIDGALLAQGAAPDMELRFFRHNSPKALRRALEKSDNPKKLVMAEGLFSVDGDMAPLADYVEICKEFDAALILDDAHGLGTLGATGRGIAEIHGVLRDVDIMIGTFSKSFGATGGFVCADQALVDYIKLQARSFVYSASLPLAQVEAALTALDFIERDHWRFKKLADNGAFFREGLIDLGLDINNSETHITPIMVRDEMQTLKFAAYLYHGANVLMMPFVSPGVAPGKERMRCNVTAAHSRSEMGYTLEALAKIGQMLEVLPAGTCTKANNLQRVMWLTEHKIQSVRNAGLGYVKGELGKAASWAKERLPF
ncbi:MAG: pyridoxal phosphate-dependent aminotransferase family protein [Deltaproteobacteria bacterium]|nr:pyridoxal phosphate-dependent aminotransferase family protein [Deltaproteobacteria bacterium]